MQVAPIASGLISTQLLTITNPVSNVAAASPAGLTEAETALRVKEQQASMAAQKIAETQTTQVTQADPAATGAKTLQNHGTDNRSSKLDESANVKTAPLLDYLDKAGSDGRSLSPNSFISSGVKSFVGIVENAQSVLAGKMVRRQNRHQTPPAAQPRKRLMKIPVTKRDWQVWMTFWIVTFPSPGPVSVPHWRRVASPLPPRRSTPW